MVDAAVSYKYLEVTLPMLRQRLKDDKVRHAEAAQVAIHAAAPRNDSQALFAELCKLKKFRF